MPPLFSSRYFVFAQTLFKAVATPKEALLPLPEGDDLLELGQTETRRRRRLLATCARSLGQEKNGTGLGSVVPLGGGCRLCLAELRWDLLRQLPVVSATVVALLSAVKTARPHPKSRAHTRALLVGVAAGLRGGNLSSSSSSSSYSVPPTSWRGEDVSVGAEDVEGGNVRGFTSSVCCGRFALVAWTRIVAGVDSRCDRLNSAC